MKQILAVVSVMILLLTSGLALAQGWRRGGGIGQGPFAASLKLSPEQIQKMQTLREDFFKETAPLREQLFQKQGELRSLWAQKNPDESAILAKQREINSLKAGLQEKMTRHRLEAWQILTPKQQERLRGFLQENGPQGPRLGMGGGFGPGEEMGLCPGW